MIAKKNDWHTEPFPESIIDLPVDKTFTVSEIAQMQKGIVPRQMEDKWFIYFEDDVLYFHRSWTGTLIYTLEIKKQNEEYKTLRALVNRDRSQYSQDDNDFDVQMINFLIDRLLLAKPVAFPVNRNIDPDKQGLFRHSMVGYGRANSEE